MWDLQIHKPEIVQQVSWDQKSPQEILNSSIEQHNKTVIELIKKDLLKDWIPQKRIDELKFWVIWNIWVLILDGKALSWYKYSKENWIEYYSNIKWLERDEDLWFWQKESLYELKDWKLYFKWKEIPQFLQNWNVNPEYIKWVDNLNFFTDMQWIFWMMKTVIAWKKLKEFNLGYAYRSIIAWVVRIKEVMYFYSKWYIPETDFERLLLRAIKELPNQCSDTRFYQNWKWERMWMEVTKSELDEYLHPTKWPPLITQSVYDNCLKRIEARDRKINEMNWVKEQSKSQRDVEKTRNWFVDRVKWILGF